MIVEREGRFVFASGRHEGRTVAEVADERPSYLTWIYTNMEIYAGLSDAVAYHLEDEMVKRGIPLQRGRRGA